MKRCLLASLLIFASVLVAVGSVAAQVRPEFEFKLGFEALAGLVPEVVGRPVEEEHYAPNGDSVQHTTKGLMVWRKADNWTAFTNGYVTWINGPLGVQSRPNAERFDWEKSEPVFKRAPVPLSEPVRLANPGWLVHDRSDLGFKISLPVGWSETRISLENMPGRFLTLFKDNPQAGSIADVYTYMVRQMSGNGGIFFAFPVNDSAEPEAGSAFLKILRLRAPGSGSLDEAAEQVIEPLTRQVAQGTVGALEHRRIAFPTGEAEEYVYAQKIQPWGLPDIDAGVVEFVFVRDGQFYDLVFVAMTDSSAGKIRQLGEAVARTLWFTK